MRDQDEMLVWFDRFLRNRTSATCSLETLCGGNPAIVEPHTDFPVRVDDQIVAKIGGSATALCYRSVSIKIDGRVLSHARNWYQEDVLSAPMKIALQQSNIPFGRIIESLNFRRVSFSSEFFWHAWYKQEDTITAILRHHAFLELPSGRPFCYLEESYLSTLRPFIVAKAFEQ